jgi:hypothetical protein
MLDEIVDYVKFLRLQVKVCVKILHFEIEVIEGLLLKIQVANSIYLIQT